MPEYHDPLDSPIVFTGPQVTSKGSSTSTDEGIGSNTHQNFLKCLGVAQVFKVDFLPITWQPALKTVGTGATARIRQALVNIQTDFAFKRYWESERCTSTEEESKMFRALIQEISVLGLLSIRSHPNIITLAGLCWDIIPESGRVWPVLVFEKSRHGDLRAFMQNGVGRRLDLEKRLELCADIATAVMYLHANSKLQKLDLI